jgi:hypothetical protein
MDILERMHLRLWGCKENEMRHEYFVDTEEQKKIQESMLVAIADELEAHRAELVDTLAQRHDGQATHASLRDFADELVGAVADYIRYMQAEDLEIGERLRRTEP